MSDELFLDWLRTVVRCAVNAPIGHSDEVTQVCDQHGYMGEHGGRLRYATVQGIDKSMPVDGYVPGRPPMPETLIEGIMAIQRIIDQEHLPPTLRHRPMKVAVKPTYDPTPQRVPLLDHGHRLQA